MAPARQAPEDAAALLGRVPIFSSLSPEERARVAQVAVPRTYERGHAIFREGDEGDTCFVIREGVVKVTRTHSDGRTITLAELRSGDMFGELAMFGEETRSATVEALERVSAVALLAPDVRRLLLANPEMAVNMLNGLAARVRATNERLSRQSFHTVAGRVASALLTQAEARRPAEDDGTGPVLIEATQKDIAELAGSSRESASRFLATLERQGVVTCGRGKVLVHDAAALRNYVY